MHYFLACNFVRRTLIFVESIFIHQSRLTDSAALPGYASRQSKGRADSTRVGLDQTFSMTVSRIRRNKNKSQCMTLDPVYHSEMIQPNAGGCKQLHGPTTSSRRTPETLIKMSLFRAAPAQLPRNLKFNKSRGIKNYDQKEKSMRRSK